MILIQEILEACELVAVLDESTLPLIQKGFLGKLIVGIIGGVAAGKAADAAGKRNYEARLKADRIGAEIKAAESNRQEIINPYANVTSTAGMASDLSSMASDLSGLITDTSSGLSNAMQNLGVATGAAEMQAEQADISLANTLDMLAATGGSAGGATALAQAALQSKKGVAANIQQQEKSNADAAAAGEMQVQTQKMQAQNRVQDAQMRGGERVQDIQMRGAERMQNINMSEAQRLQQADTQGQLFQFEQTDNREMQQLNRLSAQQQGQQQVAAQANSDKAGAIGAGIGAVGNIASAF